MNGIGLNLAKKKKKELAWNQAEALKATEIKLVVVSNVLVGNW